MPSSPSVPPVVVSEPNVPDGSPLYLTTEPSFNRGSFSTVHDCNDLLFNEFLALNDINALGKSGKRIANLLATEVVDCNRSNGC